jgi:nitrogen regulatory protein PII
MKLEPIKKVEIIIDAYYVGDILELIDKAEISGYTIIKDVRGKGERGLRDGMGLIDEFRNSYIMVCCTEEQVMQLADPIDKIVRKVGGIFLVSDSQWLRH